MNAFATVMSGKRNTKSYIFALTDQTARNEKTRTSMLDDIK